LEQYKSYAIGVWDSDGRRLTQTAVELPEGDWKMMDCFMDRDGSIYMGVGAGLLPEGIADDGLPGHLGQNSIVKFRGQGGKYPLGKVAIDNKSAPPAGALKLKGGFATGALWAYPVNTFPARCCACKQERPSLDPWARLWIPANHICSVWVIDSNGNRMARIGKYGNVDDTEADLKEERDGVRFCNVGTVTTSDTAMYALDEGNRRILKAALNFAAEETAPLP
jgi:hypothetical protein